METCEFSNKICELNCDDEQAPKPTEFCNVCQAVIAAWNAYEEIDSVSDISSYSPDFYTAESLVHIANAERSQCPLCLFVLENLGQVKRKDLIETAGSDSPIS